MKGSVKIVLTIFFTMSVWNFASQAGAGLAVAGLTATYYALARKNAQLELRNRIGDNVAGESMSLYHLSSMSSSHLLLQKELHSMSRGSGNMLGLNIVDSSRNLDNLPSFYSGLGIPNIVSRVQTSIVASPFLKDSSSTESVENDGDPSFMIDEEDDCAEIPCEKDDCSSKVLEIEQFSLNYGSDESSNDLMTSSSSESHETVIRRPTSEERLIIDRTKSPVVYYKNPEFGKRSPCKTSVELMDQYKYTSPGFDMMQELYDVGEIDQYQDSTRFLLHPILSESKTSLCDKDHEDHNVSVAGGDARISNIIDKSDDTAEEIRRYNLQFNTLKDESQGDTNQLENFLKPSVPDESYKGSTMGGGADQHAEKLKKTNNSFSHQKKCNFADAQTSNGDLFLNLPYHLKETERNETIAETSPTASIIGLIPEDSWIGLPARMFMDISSKSPLLLISILFGVLVMGFVFLAKLIFQIRGWFKVINKIEENPYINHL